MVVDTEVLLTKNKKSRFAQGTLLVHQGGKFIQCFSY